MFLKMWSHRAEAINLNINFLRKAAPRDLVAEARLLKLGKRLAMGEVTICSDGEAEPVAHVTSTYSIPPTVLWNHNSKPLNKREIIQCRVDGRRGLGV